MDINRHGYRFLQAFLSPLFCHAHFRSFSYRSAAVAQRAETHRMSTALRCLARAQRNEDIPMFCPQLSLACSSIDRLVRNRSSRCYAHQFVVVVPAPLQQLATNGRDQRHRFVSNGLTSPPTGLVPAISLQSLLPLSTGGQASNEPTSASAEQDEKERLKQDLIQLKSELQKSKETIARLQKSEEQMRERYSTDHA